MKMKLQLTGLRRSSKPTLSCCKCSGKMPMLWLEALLIHLWVKMWFMSEDDSVLPVSVTWYKHNWSATGFLLLFGAARAATGQHFHPFGQLPALHHLSTRLRSASSRLVSLHGNPSLLLNPSPPEPPREHRYDHYQLCKIKEEIHNPGFRYHQDLSACMYCLQTALGSCHG